MRCDFVPNMLVILFRTECDLIHGSLSFATCPPFFISCKFGRGELGSPKQPAGHDRAARQRVSFAGQSDEHCVAGFFRLMHLAQSPQRSAAYETQMPMDQNAKCV